MKKEFDNTENEALNKTDVISRSNLEDFKDLLIKDGLTNDLWRQHDNNCFLAALVYERNCIKKYDYTDERPSKTPIKGERMDDFAKIYQVSVKEMKNKWLAVEEFLKVYKPNDIFYEYRDRDFEMFLEGTAGFKPEPIELIIDAKDKGFTLENISIWFDELQYFWRFSADIKLVKNGL